MRNIAVAVSDDSYRQARIWAPSNDTSVSAVVQDLLLSPGRRKNPKCTHPSPTFVPNQWNQTCYMANDPFHPSKQSTYTFRFERLPLKGRAA
jgi:hypothetical protein